LVPTMGALHEGHLSLVRLARGQSDRVCATIFVNPKQFGPREDFARYPRDEAADLAKLAGENTDLLFAPSTEEMYPSGSTTAVSVRGLGDMLEGETRPGFFAGVATVVTKLLIQAGPDVAVFGEKDYQQLLVIRRLVKDLDLPVNVLAAPTMREGDGLALSSRNAYLSREERAAAPALHRGLRAVAEVLKGGREAATALANAKAAILDAGFASIDYLEVRDAENLQVAVGSARPRRVLGAAWLGRTRLIDNVPV
jgi:pantoate--beta-alanine ligase